MSELPQGIKMTLVNSSRFDEFMSFLTGLWVEGEDLEWELYIKKAALKLTAKVFQPPGRASCPLKADAKPFRVLTENQTTEESDPEDLEKKVVKGYGDMVQGVKSLGNLQGWIAKIEKLKEDQPCLKSIFVEGEPKLILLECERFKSLFSASEINELREKVKKSSD